VKYLIENSDRTDISAKDGNVNIALHYAIKYTSSDRIIQLLLEKGADPSIKNCNGSTALHYAIKCRRSYDIIQLLLEKGADPSVQDRFDRKAALHYAIQHRRSDHIIQLLLEKGADPSVQDRFDRKTALHYAIQHRRSDHIIQLLLENGVDIAIRDSYGCTALHLAIEFFDPEKTATSGILRTLLRHGANPLDTDNAGKSPLEYANDHIRPHVADIIREEMSKREGHVPEILISHTDAPAPCPRTTEASKKRLRTDNLDNPENGAKRARSEEIEQVEAQMLGEFPKGHFLHILS
jgi:ankyrin repeat protein